MVYNNYVANFYLYDLHDLYDLLLLLVTCYGPCIILFPEKYTVKDHISNTKLEKGDHYYIQTRHKDFFSLGAQPRAAPAAAAGQEGRRRGGGHARHDRHHPARPA